MADTCTICNKSDWPRCGHLDGMPDRPSEGAADEAALAELEQGELSYRKRGRPRLPPGMKRREKLVLALTDQELKAMIVTAANCEGGPVKLQDWARDILIRESKK